MAATKKWNVTIDRIEGGKWTTVVIATYYSYTSAVNEATRLRNAGYDAGICTVG